MLPPSQAVMVPPSAHSARCSLFTGSRDAAKGFQQLALLLRSRCDAHLAFPNLNRSGKQLGIEKQTLADESSPIILACTFPLKCFN